MCYVIRVQFTLSTKSETLPEKGLVKPRLKKSRVELIRQRVWKGEGLQGGGDRGQVGQAGKVCTDEDVLICKMFYHVFSDLAQMAVAQIHSVNEQSKSSYLAYGFFTLTNLLLHGVTSVFDLFCNQADGYNLYYFMNPNLYFKSHKYYS